MLKFGIYGVIFEPFISVCFTMDNIGPYALPTDASIRLINAVRDNRLAYGWSIRELSRRTGVSESTLKRFERTGILTSDKLLVILSTLRLMGPVVAALESREHWSLEQHERYNRKAWRDA
ncbi:MAG: hypothetical protein ACJA1I_000060 [Zhongshania marina]